MLGKEIENETYHTLKLYSQLEKCPTREKIYFENNQVQNPNKLVLL